MELGQRRWSMTHLSKKDSEAFRTLNQVKEVIHNPNNQYSVLSGMLDLGRDTGAIEVVVTREMMEV